MNSNENEIPISDIDPTPYFQQTMNVSDVLALPLVHFIDAVNDGNWTDFALSRLKEEEISNQNRERYINIINERIKTTQSDEGPTEAYDEASDELLLKDGKAFIKKDGELVPYTTPGLQKRMESLEEELNCEERKRRAMELL